MQRAPEPVPNPARSRLQRWLFATLGVLCVGFAGLGVIVPGLPTTVFVLAASFFFTRSCPWLEEKLLRVPLFAKSLQYLDGETSLSTTQRLGICSVIALSTGTSATLLHLSGGVPVAVVLAILALGAVGITFVALWRRELVKDQ